jgi:voltage-gated potassium channel
MTARKRIWEILEPGVEKRDRVSSVVDVFLIALIMLNVAAVVLESMGDVSVRFRSPFAAFEVFSVAIFSIEYVLRIWASAERGDAGPGEGLLRSRARFAMSPMALVDLVAILPFFLQILFPGADLRFIRVLRMVRIFKLTRYSDAMNILLGVLIQERKSFGAALFILSIVTLLASCGMYFFENPAQPVAFASIPAAMWWAIATLTTVGYGDVTPITGPGKFFGGIISVVGIGMVAMPTGILASGFNDMMRQRERKYEAEFMKAMEDGVMTNEEQKNLADLKKDLGLSKEVAKSLRVETLTHLTSTTLICPHCGGDLAFLDHEE